MAMHVPDEKNWAALAALWRLILSRCIAIGATLTLNTAEDMEKKNPILETSISDLESPHRGTE